ncbi:cysteine peptidase family C39 domain-containing protein [Fischerella sp. JS2]|uniref:cysteine peptidase family C39 domain-containing protein n=1 Tax=Fischerella sp. JS2 TaxID=2597771 RepID=UPI0028E83637|nr:cysteine peptidase family C39 domain-containing protein [Fischerella sp. JS2]
MNSYSSLGGNREPVYTKNQRFSIPKQTILKLFRIATEDTTFASNFHQVWVLREFQLGDDLTELAIARQTENKNDFLFLICQGRVRLLGLDTKLQREVSTQLLIAEQTFGVDHLFHNQPLPYRAVAASAGLVASIHVDDLKQWLQRLPNLQRYLQKITCERQTLIFFKTATELRLHTSHSLRQLLPYLEQTKVSAGSNLVEATPPSKGRFWLRCGKILSATPESQPPQVGEGWGYPNTAIPNWVAKTDLLVYHLPQQYEELTSTIAPEIFLHKQQKEDVETQGRQGGTRGAWWGQGGHGDKEDKGNTKTRGHEDAAVSSENTHAEMNLLAPRKQHRSVSKLWRRYPFIQQQSSSDCGAACLAMISLYWGKRFSLNKLRNLAQTDRMGASLSSLADAAETLGYDALPVRASLSKLELQPNPWIAHWQGIHYVVVWRVKGDRVLICDPAIGKRSLLRSEFEANWTGYALLLFPTKHLNAQQNEKVSLREFWHAFWHHRELLGQIILASVLLKVFGLAAPLITQVVLDQVLPYKSSLTLNIFAFGFLFFGIWRIIVQAVRQYLLDYFSNRMDLTLLGGFISRTLRLPLQFFASRQPGDIITRIQENRKIQLFFTKQALSTTLDAVMVIVYLGLMAYYNLRLTFIVLLLILPIVIVTAATSPLLKNASRELYQKSAVQYSTMLEIVTGVATVKTAAAERPMRWRWEESLTNTVQTRFRGQKLANNLQLATSLINHLGITFLLWYGATLVMNNQMSIGQFVAFNMLIGSTINPVLALVKLWDELQEILICAERLDDILTTQLEENSQKPQMVLPPVRGDIQFEQVCFRYNANAERNTLDNISFQIKAGQTVGIVGTNGSGKSTLVNLLAGLYRPHSGRILIDGHNIAEVSPQSLRSQLGVVPQDIFLFAGSILENITLFNSEISLEEAIAAAKVAEAHIFIQALPLGYNTRVGEGGMMLSDEQRQKIAITRALVRNPPILILDEATSCLDNASNLARLRLSSNTSTHEACTIIFVAHRLSSIRHTDHILVLDRGILIEQGNHQELMTIKGLYYHLIQQQLYL